MGTRYLTEKHGLHVDSSWIKRKSIISPRRYIKDRKAFRLIRFQDVEIDKPFVLIKREALVCDKHRYCFNNAPTHNDFLQR